MEAWGREGEYAHDGGGYGTGAADAMDQGGGDGLGQHGYDQQGYDQQGFDQQGFDPAEGGWGPGEGQGGVGEGEGVPPAVPSFFDAAELATEDQEGAYGGGYAGDGGDAEATGYGGYGADDGYGVDGGHDVA